MEHLFWFQCLWQETLEVSEKSLCKYFQPGNHVKVVTGATEGATGMVVSIEGHVVNIVSDTTKELVKFSSLLFLPLVVSSQITGMSIAILSSAACVC